MDTQKHVLKRDGTTCSKCDDYSRLHNRSKELELGKHHRGQSSFFLFFLCGFGMPGVREGRRIGWFGIGS